MISFKNFFNNCFKPLFEDFSLADAFNPDRVGHDRGRNSPSAVQMLQGTMFGMSATDKDLSNKCSKELGGEILASAHIIRKSLEDSNIKNITYRLSDKSYAIHNESGYGKNNKDLISMDTIYLKNTIAVANKAFKTALRVIQNDLESYWFVDNYNGTPIQCSNSPHFKIDDEKIVITHLPGGGMNSTKGLKLYSDAKTANNTIAKDNGYICMRINNSSDNFIFYSKMENYGIAVVSNKKLVVERPVIGDPLFLKSVVATLLRPGKINQEEKHPLKSKTQENHKAASKLPEPPYIRVPKCLKSEMGDAGLAAYKDIIRAIRKEGFAVKSTDADRFTTPPEFDDTTKHQNLSDMMGNIEEIIYRYFAEGPESAFLGTKYEIYMKGDK